MIRVQTPPSHGKFCSSWRVWSSIVFESYWLEFCSTVNRICRDYAYLVYQTDPVIIHAIVFSAPSPGFPCSLLCDSRERSTLQSIHICRAWEISRAMTSRKSTNHSGLNALLRSKSDNSHASPSSSLSSSRNTSGSSLGPSSKDNSPKDLSRSTSGTSQKTPPKGNSPKDLSRNTSDSSLQEQKYAYGRSDSQASTTSTTSVQSQKQPSLRGNSSSGSLQNAPLRSNSGGGRIPSIPVSVNRPEIELMSPLSPTSTSLKAARPPVVGPEMVGRCGCIQ